MSPLEAITRWLQSQDLDTQLEVAAFARFSIFGDSNVLTLGGPEQLEALQGWLTEPELESRVAVGRALTFRVFFEYFAEGRIAGAGWKRTEELVRRTLEQAKRDGKFAAARRAQRKLQLLPAQKENWHRVATSWNGLAATYLTREALTNWGAAEKRRDLRVISSSDCPPLVPSIDASWTPLSSVSPRYWVAEEDEEGAGEGVPGDRSRGEESRRGDAGDRSAEGAADGDGSGDGSGTDQ